LVFHLEAEKTQVLFESQKATSSRRPLCKYNPAAEEELPVALYMSASFLAVTLTVPVKKRSIHPGNMGMWPPMIQLSSSLNQ
jgi:hypothetical protein